jgi:predicted peptidase
MNRRPLVTQLLLAIAIAATCAVAAGAQPVETGFLNRTVLVDGVEFRYQVYVPRDFQRSTVWPVIIVLHGGGTYASDGISQTEGGLGSVIRRHPDRFPALVVFPQAHSDGTPSWQGKSGEAALAEIDKTIAEFNGDPSRVYLTGLSAGGNGAWYLAYHHPERFAALVVVCGFISDFTGKASGIPYPAIAPVSAQDRYAVVAKQVSSIPIWVFHGDADKTVSVDESRKMVAALKAIGANVQYTELPGVDHNAWDPTYNRVDIIEWMLKQKRK